MKHRYYIGIFFRHLLSALLALTVVVSLFPAGIADYRLQEVLVYDQTNSYRMITGISDLPASAEQEMKRIMESIIYRNVATWNQNEHFTGMEHVGTYVLSARNAGTGFSNYVDIVYRVDVNIRIPYEGLNRYLSYYYVISFCDAAVNSDGALTYRSFSDSEGFVYPAGIPGHNFWYSGFGDLSAVYQQFVMPHLNTCFVTASGSVPGAQSQSPVFSGYAAAYRDIIDRNIPNTYYYTCTYCLYDIDRNGIPELILRSGSSEADMKRSVYTYNGYGTILTGETFGGHSSICGYSGTEAWLIIHYGQQGLEQFFAVSLANNALSVSTLGEGRYATEYLDLESLTEYYAGDYTGLSWYGNPVNRNAEILRSAGIV